jgi:hypothetical protein
MSKLQHGTNIKFCQHLGKSASETLEMMHQAYREDSAFCTTKFKWHHRLKEGRKILGKDDCAERHLTAHMPKKIEAARHLVHQNCCVTVDELTGILNISCGSCDGVLSNDLNMCWVTQHVVPWMLPNDQHSEWMTICSDLIMTSGNNLLLVGSITVVDET